MWKKVFTGIFTFGIFILFFSCRTLHGNSDSIGYPVSEKTNSNTNSDNNNNRRNDPDDINWDISALDTAANADYLSTDEKDVILEMNKVRADPKKYAELYIKPMLEYNWGGLFGENSYFVPEENVYMRTNEGKNGLPVI